MKVKLIINDENTRRILQNAENVARRVAQWPAWKRNAPEAASERPSSDLTKSDDENT